MYLHYRGVNGGVPSPGGALGGLRNLLCICRDTNTVINLPAVNKEDVCAAE